jgi:hypothetical protein
MKKWLKTFNDTMAAAAFAEMGEFETARETLRENRTILLALTGEQADVKAFRYAMNSCKRLGAGLEILCSPDYETRRIKQFRSELKKEKIDHRLLNGSGCLKNEVLHYSSRNKDILFVVIESSEGLNLNCKKAHAVLSKSWKNLKCPLVVVSDLATV